MPRRKKPRGYSPKAREAHPGVTISSERGLIVLRWREELPGGRKGRRRKEVVKDAAGLPVLTRTAAEAHAVAKAKELQRDRVALKGTDHTDESDPGASWDKLRTEHREQLRRKGKSERTIDVYDQAWLFVEAWPSRPMLPKLLSLKALEDFAAFAAAKPHKDTGARLSPHYVALVLRHFKALLNFGRRRLKCVRLDAETVADGLTPPVRGTTEPVVLPTSKLKAILDAAATRDVEIDGSEVFPLLVFLMLTGCRRGEAERLRWSPSKPSARESWPDFDGGRLLVYAGKTSRQRVVPFDNRPVLREMLLALRERVDVDAKPFVFGGARPLAISRRGKTGDERGRSLKAALYDVREATGADWALKDLRSTTASFLANSQLYGSDLYSLAGQLGHDYAVLVKHYAGHFTLPPRQARAQTVEEVLGIEKILETWQSQQAGRGGKLHRLRGRA